MNKLMHRILQEDDGVLSFEWILLLTLLTIGIVGGLTAARDASCHIALNTKPSDHSTES